MTRYLHTMYRITDPDRSRAFYEALGFEFRRDMDIVRDGELEATNYFYGVPDQLEELELTFNHDGRTLRARHGVRPHRARRRRSRRHARAARRAGHRAREAAVPGARGRLAALLRARPGRLPHRADRARLTADASGHDLLMFEGRAEEAMRFYTSVFDDGEIVSLTLYATRGRGRRGRWRGPSSRSAGREFMAFDSPVGTASLHAGDVALRATATPRTRCDALAGALGEGGRGADAGRRVRIQPQVRLGHGSVRRVVAAELRMRSGQAIERGSSLYDSPVSGNCYKVRLLLSYLGLPFERVYADVADRSNRPELLGDLNPALRVPTLVLDDGRPLGGVGRDHLVLRRGHALRPGRPVRAGAGAAVDVLRAVRPRAVDRGRALLGRVLRAGPRSSPRGSTSAWRRDTGRSTRWRSTSRPRAGVVRRRRDDACGHRAVRVHARGARGRVRPRRAIRRFARGSIASRRRRGTFRSTPEAGSDVRRVRRRASLWTNRCASVTELLHSCDTSLASFDAWETTRVRSQQRSRRSRRRRPPRPPRRRRRGAAPRWSRRSRSRNGSATGGSRRSCSCSRTTAASRSSVSPTRPTASRGAAR